MIEKKIIYTHNLEFGHKNALCAPVNLSADAGEIICLIGRNGVGKSSLLNCLCGILQPLSGSIFIKNQNIKHINLGKRSQLISFVPSKPEFTANLTVFELAAMGRSPYTNIFDKKSDIDAQITRESIEQFRLEELSDRPLWSLSDGEKQRAMICRAFIQQTPVMILDEPTAFLDYKMRLKLLKDLKAMAAESAKCIIFSSHDIEPAIKHSDKIWLFEDKEICEYSAKNFIDLGLFEKITSDDSSEILNY